LSDDANVCNKLARLAKRIVRTGARTVIIQQGHVMADLEIYWDVGKEEVSRVDLDRTQVRSSGRKNCVVRRGGIELETKQSVIRLAVEGKDLDIGVKNGIFKRGVSEHVDSHRFTGDVRLEQYNVLANNSGTSIIRGASIFYDAIKEGIL